MGLNVARGFINTTTAAAGNTVVVNTLGFQPKVIFFWWNGRVDTTDSVGRRTQQTGFGYAVSASDRRYTTCLSQDTPTSMVTNRMQGNAACIGITTTADAIDGLMDLQSMDAGGFTLVIDDAFTASYTIHYMALGGADVVNVGGNNFTMAATTGNQDVEQVSFLPNFILFFSDGQTTINNSASVDARLSLGAAKSSSNRYAQAGGSNDASANAQTVSYAYDGECIALLDSGITALESRADFVDFHSSPANGFRINWLENSAANHIISYVAIQFTNANYVVLGDLLTQTDTTTDIVESGMPFQPLGGMFLSHNKAKSTQDTVQDDFEVSIGAFTSTSSRSAAGMMDDDAAGTAVVGTAVEFDAVYVNLPNTAATVEGLMDIKSVDATGFTAIMDDADPAQAFVWYMAFGPENVTVTCTSASLALTGRAAAITPGGVSIQATHRNLALAGQSASISSPLGGQTVQVAHRNLALAGQMGVVTPGGVSIQAVAESLSLAGQAANIVPGAVSIQATHRNFALAGQIATVSAGGAGQTVNAAHAALSLVGRTASILPGGVTVQAIARALTLEGHNATIVPGAVNIQATPYTFILAGRSAFITADGDVAEFVSLILISVEPRYILARAEDDKLIAVPLETRYVEVA